MNVFSRLIVLFSAVMMAQPVLSDAPVVLRSFSVNGRVHVWVEGFTGNPADYVLQRQNTATQEWTAIGTGVGNATLTGGRPFDNAASLCTVGNSFRGFAKWRVALASEAESGNWTEVVVDSRHPISGSEALSYNGWYYGSNPPGLAFDGEVGSYFLTASGSVEGSRYNEWVGIDLGAEKLISGIAFIANGGNGTDYVEIADDPSFQNPTVVATLAPKMLVADALREVAFEQPVSARYIRMRCNDADDWFSVWEFEVDEAVGIRSDDVETGCPTVTMLSMLDKGYGFDIYRSYNGVSFSKIASVAGGVYAWVDETVSPGKEARYRVGAKVSEGGASTAAGNAATHVRARHIERDFTKSRSELTGCSAIGVHYSEDWAEPAGNAFDGSLDTCPGCYHYWTDPNTDSLRWYCHNPAVGVDFGTKRHFVAKCRITAQNNGFSGRAGKLAVYGSNTELPIGTGDQATAFLAEREQISVGITPEAVAYGAVLELECDSSKSWRYIYLQQVTDDVDDRNNWCGQVPEIEFYGWSEKDVAKPGLAIIVR